MKPLTLLIFIFFIFSGVKAQEYHPFNMGTSWLMCQSSGGPGGFWEKKYYQISILGDTMINDKMYKKVGSRSRCKLYYNGQLSQQIFNGPYGIIGAIREENKRVYIYKYHSSIVSGAGPLAAGTDHLLYDFNAQVGDTVFFSLNRFERVVSITTYPPSTLKHYYLINQNNSSDSWTESIGSGYGLMGVYFPNWWDSPTCVTTQDNSYSSGSGTNCAPCGEYVDTEEPEGAPDRLTASPNPNSGSFLLKLQGGTLLKTVQVMTISGQLILEEHFDSPISEIKLNLLQSDAQLLFVRVVDVDGRLHVTKIWMEH